TLERRNGVLLGRKRPRTARRRRHTETHRTGGHSRKLAVPPDLRRLLARLRNPPLGRHVHTAQRDAAENLGKRCVRIARVGFRAYVWIGDRRHRLLLGQQLLRAARRRYVVVPSVAHGGRDEPEVHAPPRHPRERHLLAHVR